MTLRWTIVLFASIILALSPACNTRNTGTGTDDAGPDAGNIDAAPGADATPGTDAAPSADAAPDGAPPSTGEDCSNGVDDTANGLVDCADPACSPSPPCTAEVCGNGTDDDGDDAIDCDDIECGFDPGCLAENCFNGKDDTGNGDVDCADASCANDPTCLATPEVCADAVDNDGDGAVDCIDDDCWAQPICDAGFPGLGPCLQEGRQCDPVADGFVQTGFYCMDPDPAYPGLGTCFQFCDPFDFATCPTGTFCFDPDPFDNQPEGGCFPRGCNTFGSTAECPAGQWCAAFPNGYLTCISHGPVADGDPCDAGDPATSCQGGSVCILNECRPSCDTANPNTCGAGETCVGAWTEVGVGICDTTCPEYSIGQCGAGEACMGNGGQFWVCRPDPGSAEGDPCALGTDCGERSFCILGICQDACSYYANAGCDGGTGEVCIGFDQNATSGLCSTPCTGLVPDDCTDPAERCLQLSQTDFGCLLHGGGALSDPCLEFGDCGQTLYCGQSGLCEQLCQPYDFTTDLCPVTQGCYPFDSTVGACFGLTSNGTNQFDPCTPDQNLCTDAMVCAGGNCIALCRTALSDPAGQNNPDCALPSDTCDPSFGFADLGVCLP